MRKWLEGKWPLRRRHARGPAAPRPRAIGAGEVVGSESHLRTLLAAAPFKTPGEGQTNLAEAGQIALVLESGMAIPGSGLVVRGWLTDPHHEIVGLWLEVQGALRPAILRTHYLREDVLDVRGLRKTFPGYRAGFHLFEPYDLPRNGDVRANLHAVTRIGDGYALLSSGITLAAGKHCSLDRLGHEFQAGRAAAEIIAQTAEGLLDGLALGTRRAAWHQLRVEATSSKPADLAVVIVVNDNFEMLHHVLAALETCSDADRMEIVLSLQAPGVEQQVDQCVREWRVGSPFAAIKSLVPMMQIGFGMAANGGVESSEAPVVAIASDEILPPAENWAAAALERLAAQPTAVLIPTITTFDQRPFTCASALDLPWAQYEHDHSALRQVADMGTVRDCLAWGCGFMVMTRQLFDRTGRLKDSLADQDICLLDLFCRLQSDAAVQLESVPDQFTHVRLPAHETVDTVLRLWSAYAMASSVRRMVDQHEQQAATASSAAVEPDAGGRYGTMTAAPVPR